jgi:ribonuclease G
VREIMTDPCPTCEGEGVVKSAETIALELDRRIRREIKSRHAEAFLLQVHPRVTAQFTANSGRMLRELEEETGKQFHFEGSEGLPLDYFAIVLEGTRKEVEERALPFREGEEVLVHIVEPHMYEVDDAVAKIDGYIVSVVGGGPYVGEKKLVRIQEAGRTSATATLLENGNGAEADGADASARPRPRGRRGGRRRPKAGAGASAE